MALVEINKNPSRRELRQFAGIWIPVFCALAGWLLWRHGGSLAMASFVWGAGGILCVWGLRFPESVRPLLLFWMYAAFPVGWIVSYAILAAAYYLVITPVGIIMRRRGHDPLARRFDRAAESYWTELEEQDESSRYFGRFEP